MNIHTVKNYLYCNNIIVLIHVCVTFDTLYVKNLTMRTFLTCLGFTDVRIQSTKSEILFCLTFIPFIVLCF